MEPSMTNAGRGRLLAKSVEGDAISTAQAQCGSLVNRLRLVNRDTAAGRQAYQRVFSPGAAGSIASAWTPAASSAASNSFTARCLAIRLMPANTGDTMR